MNSPFDLILKDASSNNVQKAKINLKEKSGRYSLGSAKRPSIVHDNGFLDKYAPREPTIADRIAFQKWRAILIGSETLCNADSGKLLEKCSYENLSDANAAYRHFLYGNGADKIINYQNYLSQDESGKNLNIDLISDLKTHAEVIGKDRKKFSITSQEYFVGINAFGRYPSTVNWQKAIGAHVVWVSADINITATKEGDIIYDAVIVIHAEDRYNFNPGSNDIATGIPDSDNGIFEVTGLAKQYTTYGTATQNLMWKSNINKNDKK